MNINSTITRRQLSPQPVLHTGNVTSLSPRERAGVRGKVTSISKFSHLSPPKNLLLLILFILSLTTLTQAADQPRFGTVDIYLDPHGLPLTAYQLELTAQNSSVKISGIEGGEPAAFQNPPFYDPKAMQGDRVILAAFSKAAVDKLPKSKVRIATVHYLVTGEGKPEFTLKLITSGTTNARKIKAAASIEERKAP